MRLALEQILTVTRGHMAQTGATVFHSYGIDSRKTEPGGLFFALKGEQTDGHLFVQDAIRNGAAGAIVERTVHTGDAAITMIQVQDSMKALQDLAAFTRSESAAKFIGIT